MADELDKFVITYDVNSKAAESAVDKLGQSFEKVNEKGKKSAEAAKGLSGEFKEFADGASDEVGRIVPGVDALRGAVKALGAEFALAAVAVAVLGAGIKAVLDTQEQFNQQRKLGQQLGTSGVKVEEATRELVKANPAYLTRDMIAENMQKWSEKVHAAQIAVDPFAREKREFAYVGVRPTLGKTPMDALQEFAKWAHKLYERQGERGIAKVRGIGQEMGLSPEFAESLAKLGQEFLKQKQLTDAEIAARREAEIANKQFNAEMNRLKEEFNHIEVSLGTKLLPVLNDLLIWIEEFGKSVGDFIQEHWGQIKGGAEEAIKSSPVGLGVSAMGTAQRAAQSVIGKVSDWTGMDTSKIPTWLRPETPAIDQLTGLKPMEYGPEYLREKEGKEKAVQLPKPGTSEFNQLSMLDRIAAREQEAAERRKADNERFKQGVDESEKASKDQYNAATQFGRAMNMFVGAVASFANAIDDQQAMAAWAGEVGKAANLNEQTGKQGAETARALQNSNIGPVGTISQLPGELSRETTTTERHYLPQPGVVRGESREMMQQRSVQANVAGRLGVPLQQIQLGGVNQGDVSFAHSQMIAGIQNNLTRLRIELARAQASPGVPATQIAKIKREIMDQTRGLDLMRKYQGEPESRARPGPRSITVGERAIIVNVNGVKDPLQTGQATVNAIKKGSKEIANSFYTDGISH